MKLRLKEDPREWQKQLLVVVVFLDAILAGLFLRGRLAPDLFRGLQPALAALLAAGLARPVWFRGFYRRVMTVNFHVGAVLGRITLTLFYFLVITPFGLALRLAGRDLLALRRRPPGESYWRKPSPPGAFERMF